MEDQHEQLNLFEASFEKPDHLPSHIRLIEFFAGIGAQAKALEILGADFEHWRTCEWSWQSITAYNAIHMGGEIADTSQLTYGDVLREIEGVSHDYNKPMTFDQLKKKGEKWARELLGRMWANRNYCPDVSKLHAEDLGITDRGGAYVYPHLFLPLPRPVKRRFAERNGERERNAKRPPLGSRAHPSRMQGSRLPTPSPPHGKRAWRMRLQEPKAVE